MSVATPTPTPWEIEEQNWCGHPDCPHGHVELLVIGPDGLPLCRWQSDYGLDQARANFRRIVRAVNAFSALVEACKAMRATMHDPASEESRLADAALALAEQP